MYVFYFNTVSIMRQNDDFIPMDMKYEISRIYQFSYVESLVEIKDCVNRRLLYQKYLLVCI